MGTLFRRWAFRSAGHLFHSGGADAPPISHGRGGQPSRGGLGAATILLDFRYWDTLDTGIFVHLIPLPKFPEHPALHLCPEVRVVVPALVFLIQKVVAIQEDVPAFPHLVAGEETHV